jgi:hypothetical protein
MDTFSAYSYFLFYSSSLGQSLGQVLNWPLINGFSDDYSQQLSISDGHSHLTSGTIEIIESLKS